MFVKHVTVHIQAKFSRNPTNRTRSDKKTSKATSFLTRCHSVSVSPGASKNSRSIHIVYESQAPAQRILLSSLLPFGHTTRHTTTGHTPERTGRPQLVDVFGCMRGSPRSANSPGHLFLDTKPGDVMTSISSKAMPHASTHIDWGVQPNPPAKHGEGSGHSIWREKEALTSCSSSCPQPPSQFC